VLARKFDVKKAQNAKHVLIYMIKHLGMELNPGKMVKEQKGEFDFDKMNYIDRVFSSINLFKYKCKENGHNFRRRDLDNALHCKVEKTLKKSLKKYFFSKKEVKRTLCKMCNDNV